MSDSPRTTTPDLAALSRKLRDTWNGWTRAMRIFVVATVASAILLVAVVVVRGSHEPYAVLFASLEREDAASLVAKLKESKVPYRLLENGSAIEVPESRVHELRLELASAGLPQGGAVGFESFDKVRLGATEFEQRVLYRRALEGELARTVGSLVSVQHARVHLVLPERSVFVSKTEPASASVVVQLRPGKTLGPSEVTGIVHLAAASVPGLDADHVSLVTTDGVELHKTKKSSPGREDERTDEAVRDENRALESTLEERVRGMLDRIMGPGHADVRVTTEMDLARVERQEDHYDPAKSTMRSEESLVERHATDVPVAGVPGAESNVPNGDAASKKAEAGATLRESHTRNFEVDHVFEKRVATSGVVKRVTVAVVLDHAHADGSLPPRSPEEIERIRALVKNAVGFDEKRGDSVTVEALEFRTPKDVEVPPVPVAAPFRFEARKHGPWVAVGAVLLGVLVGIGSYRRRKARQAAALLAKSLEESPALTGGESTVVRALDPKSTPVLDYRAEALALASRDPASAALVVRAWLGTSPAP
ncbi:MAG: flagellar basal-body MS-ring/collar protein FliF [Polyangiaceae bacterium]